MTATVPAPTAPAQPEPPQPQTPESVQRVPAGRWLTFVYLCRLHIIAIATLAALTFGWLMSGRHLWAVMAFGAVDWFVVNLMNRVADLDEDRLNGIPGTEVVASRGRWLELGCAGLALASLAIGHLIAPGLTPWRVAFTLIGLAYNYRVIPWPGGRTRFKEMYFWKNTSSAGLFVISTLAYPVVLAGGEPDPWLVGTLLAFFFPLEITYEIIYDLRDVQGDAQLRVPTYPVVHGVQASHRIIWVLIGLSALGLLVPAGLGRIGLAEVALIGGPIQQALYFGTRIRHQATAERCIFLTWLGAAQIASYHLWIFAGLPTSWPA